MVARECKLNCPPLVTVARVVPHSPPFAHRQMRSAALNSFKLHFNSTHQASTNNHNNSYHQGSLFSSVAHAAYGAAHPVAKVLAVAKLFDSPA